MTDPDEPADWVHEKGEEGERYAYPATLNTAGFFEDYHDGDPTVIATFWRSVNQQLSAAS